jgi:hypothetical protein
MDDGHHFVAPDTGGQRQSFTQFLEEVPPRIAFGHGKRLPPSQPRGLVISATGDLSCERRESLHAVRRAGGRERRQQSGQEMRRSRGRELGDQCGPIIRMNRLSPVEKRLDRGAAALVRQNRNDIRKSRQREFGDVDRCEVGLDLRVAFRIIWRSVSELFGVMS